MNVHPTADLAAYLDGELESELQASLETHLDGCSSCREELARQRSLDASLAALPRIEPSPAFEARFWARLARQQDTPQGPFARLLAWWTPARGALGLAGVAAAALALALVLPLGEPATLDPGPDWEIVADAERYKLLTEDLELLEMLEILEAWNGEEA